MMGYVPENFAVQRVENHEEEATKSMLIPFPNHSMFIAPRDPRYVYIAKPSQPKGGFSFYSQEDWLSKGCTDDFKD